MVRSSPTRMKPSRTSLESVIAKASVTMVMSMPEMTEMTIAV